MMRIFNTTEMKERRKLLRSNMTDAETTLWSRIRRKQIDGYRFRRQYSIGSYIVDFYCPEMHLAVEIDGRSHNDHDAKEYDSKREEEIHQLGITFIRFRNEEVSTNLCSVVERIKNTIHSLSVSLDSDASGSGRQ